MTHSRMGGGAALCATDARQAQPTSAMSTATPSTTASASPAPRPSRSGHPQNRMNAAAKAVGTAVAERARKAGVDAVVFDRNGFRYHGRIKAVADGAREGGLKF